MAHNKPEPSFLNVNESEFNLAENSFDKDIIETSNCSRPADFERLVDKNIDNRQELKKRFRKLDSKNNIKKDQRNCEDFDIFTTEVKQPNNEVFQEPTNFPDLDTSDIAVDAPHH